jgi:hypothetical protein
MSDGFTKLFGSLIHSTIWREKNHVRLVWITMLAMVNRHGVVEASLPGVADAARVTIEECEDAIAKLSSPDPYSRSKDHDGRRITTVDGGWRLLNYETYRKRMSQEDQREKAAERQQRFRDNHPERPRTKSERPPSNVAERNHGSAPERTFEDSEGETAERTTERTTERNAPVTPRNGSNDIAEADREAEADQVHPPSGGRDVAPKFSKPVRRKPRSALPKEWRPSPEHLEKAQQSGLSCNAEFEKFRAHAEANGRIMASWNAAFTTWLLNAVEFSQRGGARARGTPEPRQPSRGYDPTKHAEKL